MMRDRLVELIKHDNCISPATCSSKCKYVDSDDCHAERLADHLIANKVIIQPIQVRDETFLLLERLRGGYDIIESRCVRIERSWYGETYSMAFDCLEIGNTLEFTDKDIGITVFLSREEAENKKKSLMEDWGAWEDDDA